ncbi:MAG: 7-cyano-7-deazaguanine synthase QueC [Candidatus Fischerbacteria bacterium RBG_13_37_8]|uniref:7-cyano-7-deazaguanine synthase n=1 Tax=Candidatus Fischerbacteria bacterium RBG_13_37_8 TaxID=1817863 RepID=A0A1F5VR68_9BACT|nr:MAG: 7-cyano-7-deazaguanine synthase QueC [Candidatus Fischerbacteria bacterium RBG_13_37_8]
MEEKKAIILLSGGIDSATCLALAIEQHYEPFCLSVLYKQRHAVELEAAKRIAAFFNVKEHKILTLDLSAIGGSALTSSLEVPKDRIIEHSEEIPKTYVPARNTIFLALALAWAEVMEAGDIFIGTNAVDFSGYPDCRPGFIKKFEELANIATKAAVENKIHFRIHAPLVHLTKSAIITLAIKKGVNLSLTHSCYDPTVKGIACGRCDSCLLRLKGFKEAGLEDPAVYFEY